MIRTPRSVKAEIVKIMMPQCDNCGWRGHQAALQVIKKHGMPRPAREMTFLEQALDSAVAERGLYALWCKNCLAIERDKKRKHDDDE